MKEIDHILVNTWWKSLANCRVFRGLEFWSDHRPVLTTLKLHLKKTKTSESMMKKLDVGKRRRKSAALTAGACWTGCGTAFRLHKRCRLMENHPSAASHATRLKLLLDIVA